MTTKKPSWRFFMAGMVILAVGVLLGSWLTTQKETSADKALQHGNATDNQDVKDESKAVMAVEAIVPEPLSVSQTISANGTIHAKQTAEVSGHLTGSTIEQVLVDVGDVVKKGQVLAVLDGEVLQDALVGAKADLAQAKANHAKAKADLARVEPLLTIDAISRQEVDAYQTALVQADLAVIASQARLKTATDNLKRTQIIAPVSGVVSAKTAQVGMLVSGTPLFSIIQDGQLEWQAMLEPSQANRIQVGQVANLTVGETVIAGRVSHLSPVASSGREVIAHVTLPRGVPVKAGMYQTGKFLLGSQILPAVPISAVMTTDGYDYVWTLILHKSDIYKVKRTKVMTGTRTADKVALTFLEETLLDVLMVKQGGSFLSEGDFVKVVPAQSALPVANTQGQ